MNEKPNNAGRPTMASIQAGIDGRMFEQTPIHIIERYLESFSTDGRMTFPVAEHILEALASRFRAFMTPSARYPSLDNAFGGQVARQRQARHSADQQYDVSFQIAVERDVLSRMTKAGRGPGTPYEIACERVAEQLGLTVDNIRRLDRAEKARKKRRLG